MILLLVKTLRRNFALLLEERHLTFWSKFKICLIRQHVINHIEISRSEKNTNSNEKNRSNSRKLQQRGCAAKFTTKIPSTCYTRHDNGKAEIQPPADRDKHRISASFEIFLFTIKVKLHFGPPIMTDSVSREHASSFLLEVRWILMANLSAEHSLTFH